MSESARPPSGESPAGTSRAGSPLPRGARLCLDYLPAGDAPRLRDLLDGGPWRDDLKRRVQHYGWRYDYRARKITHALRLGPLPLWLTPLASTIGDLPEFERVPDQVIVNEYCPGQGISAHVDCEPCFGPAIASLSLGGAVEMVFRHRRSGERASLVLPPLSLLVLTGEARYDWTHEIPARRSNTIDGMRLPRTRRVSLTFRTVIREP